MKNGFIGFRIDSYQTECVSTVTRKRGEYTRVFGMRRGRGLAYTGVTAGTSRR